MILLKKNFQYYIGIRNKFQKPDRTCEANYHICFDDNERNNLGSRGGKHRPRFLF